jgi:hypothetical protein
VLPMRTRQERFAPGPSRAQAPAIATATAGR